jgi:uncharacterized protein YndB with AHSA1/START domain
MMPVKKDATGRRYVEAQAEVPGTPEEVWQAIALGPGLSSWFVPSKVEERVGGTAVLDFGPGMESTATVTVWEPPRRLALENADDLGPGSPTVATEWTIETRAGGTCIVRVIHSWFATSDDWDDQYEGVETGWPCFFRILRIYLAHHRGEPSASFQMMAMTPAAVSSAWSALLNALGIQDPSVSTQVRTAAGAPPLVGRVEHVGRGEERELLLRLHEPAAGVSHAFAMEMGGQTCVFLRIYLYGDAAAAVAAREAPRWQAWMSEWSSSHGDRHVQGDTVSL